MPALVSCCFVWVSQAVTMTTTSSYWTDVICDIMLNGKEKEEETVPKIRRMEQNLLLPLEAPSTPAYRGRSQRTTMLGLLKSQAAATLSLPNPRQC